MTGERGRDGDPGTEQPGSGPGVVTGATRGPMAPGPAKGPDFRRLGDLLGEVELLRGGAQPSGRCAEVAASGADPCRRLAALWVDIVGPEIAENAQPVQLKNGRLVVATSSSAWAQTLQFMSEDIRARINRSLQADAVRDIGFRHAGWEAHSRSAAAETTSESVRPAAESLSTSQRDALEELSGLDLDRALKDKIIRAMQAAFVRGEQDSDR